MHKFRSTKTNTRLVTFDGQVVELFQNNEQTTLRYHIDLIESIEIVEKWSQTLMELKHKPKQKQGMTVTIDDDQREAAEALVAAVQQALLNRG